MRFSKMNTGLLSWLLAAQLLVACGGDEAAPAATAPVASNPPTVQPTVPAVAAAAAELPSDPKAAIIQAMRAQLTAGPYRTTMLMDGDTQASVGTIIPPDRLHVVMNMGEIKTEMIYIGDKVWSKQGDEAWQESDNLGTPGGGLVDESMIVDLEKTITEAALVGPEVVDGVDTLVYSFTSDQSKSELMPLESISQIKVWINTATGLIIRQEIADTTAGEASKTVQVIEYDDSITIEPPAR